MAGARDVFEVEGILDQRMRRGRPEYLIRWLGFDEDDDTWEPEKNLMGCEEILEEWKRKWLAAQTPRRTKIVKPIFKPPPTPRSTRRRTVQKVEEKTETKIVTPGRGRPRKNAAPTPKLPSTPSRKTRVTTVTESDNESDQELKRSALRSRDLSRQVFSTPMTASTVTTRQERSEFTERKAASAYTTRSSVKNESLTTYQDTPVTSKLTRASLNSVRDGRVGVSPLFAGARSKVAVRVGKVRSLLTCHNLLNLVFVACMGAVFYTLFFFRK
ncbi:testis-specific chromodomain protein Y 2-like isoform X4 [Branchiostoma lanceolatum]|uniref:testis-specific chromodomain protein Y 2-like isoform X4 n=1 Tax=Branchiostoma lanceolatum TaxID=7740 RepID=UPI0034556F76